MRALEVTDGRYHSSGARIRTRRRLGRTISRARWREYRRLLTLAQAQGYALVSLESWLANAEAHAGRDVLILRHDVDQCPASAARMAAIESELGICSTWYFRWRTAQPKVIEEIREGGHEVGLHYETLTRELLRRGLRAADAATLIPEVRPLLRAELAAFAERHGPARSTCPHGDTRMRGVHNGVLLQGEDLSAYGVRWEASAAVGRFPLDVWLTDRSSAEGRWRDGIDPVDLLVDRRSPILAVVHPNNWVSGLGLWWDRMLPDRFGMTGSDAPSLERVAAGLR
ncbi:MAG TPA: hypothetical protein VGL57_05870 [Solirubrobacteraceae bacterium]|jgi:hypothetical protein